MNPTLNPLVSIFFSPINLFFGRDGNKQPERLVGGASSDFYGSYLDERIARLTPM